MLLKPIMRALKYSLTSLLTAWIASSITPPRLAGSSPRSSAVYNLFRLTGRYEEAAYLRELFDEKATALYQVAALIRSLDEASGPGSAIPLDALRTQTDELIVRTTEALEGERESLILRQLLRVKPLDAWPPGQPNPAPGASRQRVDSRVPRCRGSAA